MPHDDFGSAAEVLELPALPVLEFDRPRSVLVVLLPIVMLAGTVGFLVIGGGGTTSLLMGGLMAVSLVGMLLSGGGRHTKPAAQITAERERFLRQLDRVGVEVAAREQGVRTAAHHDHPAPGIWEPPDGADLDFDGPFLVRVGVGTVPAVVHCAAPADDGDVEPEPFAAIAQRWFLAARTGTTAMPLTVELRPGHPLVLIGGVAGDLARSVVLGWALRVPPERCRVVLMAADDADGWEWLRWLPHHRGTGEFDLLRTDDILVARAWISRPAGTRPALTVGLLVTVGQPRAVRETLCTPLPGLVAIHVEPSDNGFRPGDLVLHAADGELSRVTAGRPVPWGVPDAMGPASAMSVARRRVTRDSNTPGREWAGSGSRATGLASLLGVSRPSEHRPELRGTEPAGADRLRVPIGVDDDGGPVLLDLKESSEGGAGPHGLLIGATGSGKSELLRTLVLALSVTHSPSSLNLVLIDFKGGAGFLAFADLPHVAAVITNLAEQSVLIARMRDALTGELNRRQELLRRAGNLSSLAAYERARSRSPELPALPALVVVCDEFTELLVRHPDLAETFVTLGRLGRSLGVHLLMASQRMEEGRMRGLDAHLSYRIALRTFSAADSRAVLDSDAAYRLPSSPGAGYVRTDGGPPRRFSAAYVSGALTVDAARSTAPRETAIDHQIHVLGAAPVPKPAVTSAAGSVGTAAAAVPSDPDADTSRSEESPSLVELWVGRLRGTGPAAHRIWLPPLDVAPALDELGDLPAAVAGAGRLRIPVGVIDRPYDQRHDLLWADLTGSTGHALVVGGPRAGKSTLVATLLLGLARHHPPAELHFYAVDLGGGTLAPLAELPHTAAVAHRDEPERVRRLLAQLTGELEVREKVRTTAAAPPDLILVIDGWTSFRTAFDDLEQPVAALVDRGLAYGIHVLLTVARWADVRPALKDLMGLRFELRLGDPADSECDRRRAAEVPEGSPGRGLTSGGLHFLTAAPGPVDAPGSLSGAVHDRRERWPAGGAPPVQVLPTLVTTRELAPLSPGSPAVAIGVGESALATVAVDLQQDPHLVVWGDTSSGKTAFLHTLAASLAARSASTEARFLVIDHRRTLLGRLPTTHLAGHATSAGTTAALVTGAAQVLTARLPGDDVTAEQLRRRSWWSGADLFVLVDDYELVAAGQLNPLGPLLALLPHARDIGLHLVVCRRASGGGRAQYDPVLQLLRELGSPGLVLSGPADEGPLHGAQRASPQPPGRGHLVTRTSTELIQLAVAGD